MLQCPAKLSEFFNGSFCVFGSRPHFGVSPNPGPQRRAHTSVRAVLAATGSQALAQRVASRALARFRLGLMYGGGAAVTVPRGRGRLPAHRQPETQNKPLPPCGAGARNVAACVWWGAEPAWTPCGAFCGRARRRQKVGMRQGQDSNLRTETVEDFESSALTARPPCHRLLFRGVLPLTEIPGKRRRWGKVARIGRTPPRAATSPAHATTNNHTFCAAR